MTNLEAIAKLHSAQNLRFFRRIQILSQAAYLKSAMTACVETEPAKKSTNFARKASFAITSLEQRTHFSILTSLAENKRSSP